MNGKNKIEEVKLGNQEKIASLDVQPTKQENKNLRNFMLSFIILYLGVAVFIIAIQENIGWLFGVDLLIIVSNFLWMFYIGYSHGWEHRRIYEEKKEK